jgi:hypothetical protein
MKQRSVPHRVPRRQQALAWGVPERKGIVPHQVVDEVGAPCAIRGQDEMTRIVAARLFPATPKGSSQFLLVVEGGVYRQDRTVFLDEQ